MNVSHFNDGSTIHRASATKRIVGGKGINVSKMCAYLDTPSKAIVFIGGTSGQWINDALKDYPLIDVIAFHVCGESRINVKIRGKHEMDINAPGPTIGSSQVDQMLFWFKSKLECDDIVILSGALARGIQWDQIMTLSSIIMDAQARFILDVPSIPLDVLSTIKPELIKPNIEELRCWYDQSDFDCIDAMVDDLLDHGVTSILLSQGSDGAIYKDKSGHHYHIDQPAINAKDTTACGDAMLAGYVTGLYHHYPLLDRLKLAGACGFASAQCVGLADRSLVETSLNQITTTSIE